MNGSIFPNGDVLSASAANYGSDGTKKVGSYPPNGFGLYDMSGNVFEWCDDWYDDNYYEVSPPDNPRGPETGSVRVRRGGSFSYAAEIQRCANRAASGPTFKNNSSGFRIVVVE